MSLSLSRSLLLSPTFSCIQKKIVNRVSECGGGGGLVVYWNEAIQPIKLLLNIHRPPDSTPLPFQVSRISDDDGAFSQTAPTPRGTSHYIDSHIWIFRCVAHGMNKFEYTLLQAKSWRWIFTKNVIGAAKLKQPFQFCMTWYSNFVSRF